MLPARLGEYGDSPLYACHLAAVGDALPGLSFESRYFLCLIGGDFTRVSPGYFVTLVSGLLASGACYFLCCGAGSELARNLIDDILIGDERYSSEDAVVMTESHNEGSEEDAIFHLLCTARPSEKYLDDASTRFAILLDQPETFEIVSAALLQPDEFVARITA